MPSSPIAQVLLRTGLGSLILSYEEERLTAIQFGEYRRDRAVQGAQIERGTSPGQVARTLIDDLIRYFSGIPTNFETELDLRRYTDFQQAVWRATLAIPYGHALTYGQIASGLGRRNGARAVGAALGQNPFPILIPCHRVLGSNGALTGFGGGLDWKQALLSLENGQKDMF